MGTEIFHEVPSHHDRIGGGGQANKILYACSYCFQQKSGKFGNIIDHKEQKSTTINQSINQSISLIASLRPESQITNDMQLK